MAEKKEKPNKKIPTILPSGFGIRVSQRKMILLDFVDIDYENNANVIGSYALDKKMLEDLSATIQDVLKEMNK